MMKRPACAMLGLLLMASGGSAVDPGPESTDPIDGRTVVTKAAAAIKRAKMVSYTAEYTATGWVAKFVANVQGKALVGKQSKWEIARFRCDVKLRKPGSTEVRELSAGCDGEQFFLVDPVAKTAYQDMDPAVLGKNGRDVQRVVMEEFSSPEPFKEQLEAETIELTGTESVAGVECYRVHIKSDTPPEVDWFFSKKDRLPRKVIRTYANRQDPEGEAGTTQLVISDLVVNPELEKDPFTLVVPEGFAKTDDFAP